MSFKTGCLNYLNKTFDIDLKIDNVEMPKSLPAYFTRNYELYHTRLLDKELYFLYEKQGLEPLKIKQIVQRIKMISDLSDIPVVYCTSELDKYSRDRLIAHRMSFIVSSMQIFIPHLGIALEEYYAKKMNSRKQFTPATQYILFLILDSDSNKIKVSDFQGEKLSRMSINRSLDELAQFGLLTKEKFRNSAIWYRTITQTQMWEKAQQYLFNPIQQTELVYFNGMSNVNESLFHETGEMALSTLTNLAESQNVQLAVHYRAWSAIKQYFTNITSENEQHLVIQVWKHQVPLWNGNMHPLMLQLLFSDEMDERISISVNELVNKYWSNIYD